LSWQAWSFVPTDGIPPIVKPTEVASTDWGTARLLKTVVRTMASNRIAHFLESDGIRAQ